jgi:hypothetical protein
LAVCRELIAIFMVLLVGSAASFAADAKGWYDNCCDMTEFHFTRFPEQAGKDNGEDDLRVTLFRGRLPLVEVPDTWWGTMGKVTGRKCDHGGNCEEAIKADLQVLRVTKSHIWGIYVVDFNNRHLEGRFNVKYRQRRPVCICE